MENGNLAELTVKQARKALATLGPLSDWDNVTSTRSPVDGFATVTAHMGRRWRRVALGPRGGIVSDESGSET